MFAHRTRARLAYIIFGLIALALAACGQRDAKVANVTAGKMPDGGEWTGVYYSPVYGYLHLVEQGNSVEAAWRTAAGDAQGKLHGTINGDLLKYEWTEHKIGLVGPSANSKGRGYFRYTIPTEGEAHEIRGEWGLNDSETGNGWKAVKQGNMKPDLKSVMPDEIEGRVEAGGWDDSGPKPKSDSEEESGGE
jgi:hypothetical protein